MFLTPELIMTNPTLSAIFKGIRPAVVALILAPVYTSAKSAGINWRTIWIPIVVALLIWSKIPYLSNPILYIIIGGVTGWLMLRRSHRLLQEKKAEGGSQEQ
jgi:chromate transporter